MKVWDLKNRLNNYSDDTPVLMYEDINDEFLKIGDMELHEVILNRSRRQYEIFDPEFHDSDPLNAVVLTPRKYF